MTHRFPRVLALVVALLATMSFRAATRSQTAASSPRPEHFAARAVAEHFDPEGARDASALEPVDIGIQRWSTDAERDTVVKAILAGDDRMAVTRLLKTRGIGYLRYVRPGVMLPPEQLRQNLQYAFDTTDANGERRIILATAPYDELCVIEIRFAHGGAGEGRVGKRADVAISKDQKTIELAAYAQAQVFLHDVRTR